MAEPDAAAGAVPADGPQPAPARRGPDIERLSKLLAVLATAIGLIISIASFLQTTRKDVETRRLTAREPFLKKQQELYLEIVKVAAQLATKPEGSAELAPARQRFLELYYGELSLVEDENVEASMVKIKDCLDAGKDC